MTTTTMTATRGRLTTAPRVSSSPSTSPPPERRDDVSAEQLWQAFDEKAAKDKLALRSETERAERLQAEVEEYAGREKGLKEELRRAVAEKERLESARSLRVQAERARTSAGLGTSSDARVQELSKQVEELTSELESTKEQVRDLEAAAAHATERADLMQVERDLEARDLREREECQAEYGDAAWELLRTEVALQAALAAHEAAVDQREDAELEAAAKLEAEIEAARKATDEAVVAARSEERERVMADLEQTLEAARREERERVAKESRAADSDARERIIAEFAEERRALDEERKRLAAEFAEEQKMLEEERKRLAAEFAVERRALEAERDAANVRAKCAELNETNATAMHARVSKIIDERDAAIASRQAALQSLEVTKHKDIKNQLRAALEDREDALRKLKRTEASAAQRTEEIEAERDAALARCAALLVKHKDLEAERQKMADERDAAGVRAEVKFQETLKERDAAVRRAERALTDVSTAAKTHSETASRDVADLRDKCERLEAEVDELRRAAYKSRAAGSSSEDDPHHPEEQEGRLSHRSARLSALREKLDDRRKEAEDAVAKLRAERDAALEKAKETESRLTQRSSRLHELRGKLDNRRKEADSDNAIMTSKQTNDENFNVSHIQELEGDLCAAKLKIAELATELDQTRHSLAKCTKSADSTPQKPMRWPATMTPPSMSEILLNIRR